MSLVPQIEKELTELEKVLATGKIPGAMGSKVRLVSSLPTPAFLTLYEFII